MKDKIKYSYCLDENNHLVHICDIDTKESAKHHYVCLECGHVMHPRMGKINAPHFAHNPGESCHGESYLHKLAKRRIMDSFMQLKGMKLVRRHEVPCEDEHICPFYSRQYCYKDNSKTHNLQDYYNCCQEEVYIQGFIADLLLTNSNKENREPVLIEVLVTHACEPEKIRSGLKIINSDKLFNDMTSFPVSEVLVGLIYLKSKGHDIRNCLLCKYYCWNDYFGESICKLYKKCGTPHNPKQTSALHCQYYRISQDVMTMIDKDLLMDIVVEINPE